MQVTCGACRPAWAGGHLAGRCEPLVLLSGCPAPQGGVHFAVSEPKLAIGGNQHVFVFDLEKPTKGPIGIAERASDERLSGRCPPLRAFRLPASLREGGLVCLPCHVLQGSCDLHGEACTWAASDTVCSCVTLCVYVCV